MTTSAKTPPKVTYTNSGTDFGLLHELYDEAIPALGAKLGRRHPNWIGGQPSTAGEVYVARSPIDSDIVLGEFYAATPQEVERAIAVAHGAQRGWQAIGWEKRVVILRRIAEEIDRRKMELCAAAIYEVGKSRLEASAEVDETSDLIRHYAAEMERSDGFAGEQKRGFQGEDVRSIQRPYGVFGVIAPFNFPFALVCGMMSAALVAGNAVVFKPSPMAGLSATLIQECFAAGGLPDGVLNILNGHDVTGRAIVEAPGIDGIAFTGSNDVGMTILRHFASGPFAKPVLAEMGGKNPSYVSARANFDDAVAGVRESAFGLQGQRCSANSVCFVERPIFENFVNALAGRTAELSIGDVRDRATYMGAVVNEAAGERWRQPPRRRPLRSGRLRRADHRHRPAGRPRSLPEGTLCAVHRAASLRYPRGSAEAGQLGPLRPLGRHLFAGSGRGRLLRRQRRGRRALCQPRARRDHRRLAGRPVVLRLEGLGHDRQGRPRQLVRPPVHARTGPHLHADPATGLSGRRDRGSSGLAFGRTIAAPAISYDRRVVGGIHGAS